MLGCLMPECEDLSTVHQLICDHQLQSNLSKNFTIIQPNELENFKIVIRSDNSWLNPRMLGIHHDTVTKPGMSA